MKRWCFFEFAKETSSTSTTSPFSLNLLFTSTSTSIHHHSLSPKKDISLYYTLTYAAGLAFNLAYLVLENALVGWIVITVELVLALAVIAAKLWLERGGRGKRDAEAKQKCAEQTEKERREEEEKEAKERAKEAAERTTTIAETRV